MAVITTLSGENSDSYGDENGFVLYAHRWHGDVIVLTDYGVMDNVTRALIQSILSMDRRTKWTGYKAVVKQACAWPRSPLDYSGYFIGNHYQGPPIINGYGEGEYPYDSSAIPSDIVNGQYELAYTIYKNPSSVAPASTQTSSLKEESFSIGSISSKEVYATPVLSSNAVTSFNIERYWEWVSPYVSSSSLQAYLGVGV